MNPSDPNFKEKKWKSEFDSFNDPANSIQPENSLSQGIFQYVRNDLSPSSIKVFLNLLRIHVIAGSLTLVVCPQFGIGPLGGGNGLVGLIENYGPWVCGAFCGTFFLFFSAILAGLFLSRPERKKIHEHLLLTFSALTLVSLFGLLILGLMVQEHHHAFEIPFLLMWVIVGSLSALMGFSVASHFRNQLRTTRVP